MYPVTIARFKDGKCITDNLTVIKILKRKGYKIKYSKDKELEKMKYWDLCRYAEEKGIDPHRKNKAQVIKELLEKEVKK